MKECSGCEEFKSLESFYSGRNKCKNCLRLQKIDYRNSNREKVREASRRYNKTATSKEYRKFYKKSRPHLKNAESAKRRASKLNATPEWADLSKIRLLYEKVKWLEALTGLKYHVDHIIPLRGKNVCGLHIWENLQILEASINESKGNKVYKV